MKKLLLVFALFAGLSSFGQQTTNQFSLNFLTPSAEYELAVGDNASVDFIGGVAFAYRHVFDESDYGIFPQFMGQYRYYYNFKNRIRKAKNVSNNSGNYIAAVALLSSGNSVLGDLDLSSNYDGFVGPAWGLQRVYGKTFKLNLNLGLGYGFNDVDSYLAPLVSLQLGFKL
ncbi:DUF3575 domain-containing protein [Zunongwangia sp. F363]|uniref:DUF3575 domain-containing protein n=1 Tax=Autumnicola tepida TaxID=3075595 RepID=A0ABU3C830_9FLAO|nr:DUF3575 domain-containing protein [Zunongwangia sp. F363]MDT0642357.1 DUF3575 domain-containing protein [Zunongwangia sp. F363]